MTHSDDMRRDLLYCVLILFCGKHIYTYVYIYIYIYGTLT